jgi:hypothetical protein
MTAALTNPYTPGQVPRIFAGRVAELGRIRDQLSRVATFGELGGPLLVFHAPRGLGKTSLLRTAQRQAAELGFVSVWVACSRDRPFLPELVRGVERALHRAELRLDADEGRRWQARLERVSVELGVPGLKVRGDIHTGAEPRQGSSTPAAPIGALEDLLHDAASLVRGRGGAGLLVFIDELHAASADDLSILLNALQNLDGEREENPLAVVTAGLPVTPEAITRAATFGERSTFVPLDLLSDADARSLLTAPAAALEVTWTPEALDLVTGECRGHPYLLQLLGSTSWTAAQPVAAGRVDGDHVRAGIPAAKDQLDAMYRARWGSATPAEKAFVRAMAQVGTDNVSRAQIATNLGQDTHAISVPRERLIEKGVIEPVGHGLVRFTLPGFAEYVRERASG